MTLSSTSLPLLRLLQITSPSLPVGAYSYSQGLEWVVEKRWVDSADSFKTWLTEQLNGAMAQQELPLLLRLLRCSASSDEQELQRWDAQVMARRETAELRQEERNRGRALLSTLKKLPDKPLLLNLPAHPLQSQLAAYAVFCSSEKVSHIDAMTGFAYSWLDSQVTAGIKLVPLGQSEAQAVIYQLSGSLQNAVQTACEVNDEDIGYTMPAVALASSLHETQYSRSFRS